MSLPVVLSFAALAFVALLALLWSHWPAWLRSSASSCCCTSARRSRNVRLQGKHSREPQFTTRSWKVRFYESGRKP